MLSRISLLIAIFPVLAIVVVLNSRQVHACSCMMTAPADQARLADTVFIGTAEGVRHHTEKRIGSPDGPTFTEGLPGPIQEFLRQGRPIYQTDELEVNVRLEASFKGRNDRETTVWAKSGELTCGFNFQAGEQYTVFANPAANGRLITGLCAGTLAGAIVPSAYNLAPQQVKELSATPMRGSPWWIWSGSTALTLLATLALGIWMSRRKKRRAARVL